MGELSQDRQLFREAADLAIRLQNDPDNPVTAELLRAWLARDPACQAAWTRVAAIHGMTGKVLTGQMRPAGGQAMTRRNLVLAGLLGLGATAGGGLYLPDLLMLARADYHTGVAGQKRIELPDGSTVTLGPDSAIAVRMSELGRDVDLLQGMAFFEVAPDLPRPFAVTAGAVRAVALGTAFDVSFDAGYVSVSVDHGLVQVAGSGTPALLQDGDWLTLTPETVPLSKRTTEKSAVAAWRRGMMFAEDETVSALVARIARWQKSRVIIADAGLGSRLVSGVFYLSEPAAAFEAVVRPFDAHVRKITPFLTVISRL